MHPIDILRAASAANGGFGLLRHPGSTADRRVAFARASLAENRRLIMAVLRQPHAGRMHRNHVEYLRRLLAERGNHIVALRSALRDRDGVDAGMNAVRYHADVRATAAVSTARFRRAVTYIRESERQWLDGLREGV